MSVLDEAISEVLAGTRRWHVEHGSCLDVLLTMPDSCVDSVVADPPGGIAFMGRDWDKNKGGRDHWIAWLRAILEQCNRVLKPGGHVLVWSIPRTQHWTGMAVEDAGFEIRDGIDHLFGSGMPKSHNAGKAIHALRTRGKTRTEDIRRAAMGDDYEKSGRGRATYDHGCGSAMGPVLEAPPDAQNEGSGYGTGLKPSHETWILGRKRFKKSVASNFLEHGTGALNIDGCRIAHADAADLAAHTAQVDAIKARGGSMADSWKNSSDLSGASDVNAAGRWPANTVLTHSFECKRVGTVDVKQNPTWDTPNRETVSGFTGEDTSSVQHGADGIEAVATFECVEGCPVLELDRQSGQLKSGDLTGQIAGKTGGKAGGAYGDRQGFASFHQGDTGAASRYFPQFQLDPVLDDITPFTYVPKPSRAERDMGLSEFRSSTGGEATLRKEGSKGTKNPRAGAGRSGGSRNVHPTVKGIALMRWFCRLVTPKGGVVLDPFTGSGTTGCAAMMEGLRFVGIELNDTPKEPFVSIARARLHHVIGGDYVASKLALATAADAPKQMRLF